ncbi:hypothetical protein ACQEU3_47210 [Spirillospora sp. CA-253888]
MTALLVEPGALTARWLNPPGPDATPAETYQHELAVALDRFVQTRDDIDEARLTATAGTDTRTLTSLIDAWSWLRQVEKNEVALAWWQDENKVELDAVDAVEDLFAQVMGAPMGDTR